MTKLSNIVRRQFLALIASAACAAPAFAEDPIRLVVPFPPGGALDYTGRLLAEQLKTTLGRDLIVDNRGGANGNIGAVAVVNAAADGNTLLMAADGVITVNPSLYKTAGFKPSDLKPIGMVATLPQLLVVPAASPIKTLADFVAEGRKRELTYASGGVGSGGHLAMAYFAQLAGMKTLHVPFQGGAPAMTALIGQQVDSSFLVLPGALPQVQGGKLRALAVSSPKRVPQLPDVPTLAEAGYKEFVVEQAYLLMAPAKLADAQVAKLGTALSKVVANPEFQKGMADRGMTATWMDAGKTSTWLTAEGKRWAEVISTNAISQ
ncbi:tripartite tricarboxylate transporter substrate binding protein [Piscinibacter sakaiensis]|uniref:tripartite tricarboxylate transporter substrate binding protein n=1 Tax=Piscinibacter sakaiensis TaxID=1547922 RepID=UPI003AAE7798